MGEVLHRRNHSMLKSIEQQYVLHIITSVCRLFEKVRDR